MTKCKILCIRIYKTLRLAILQLRSGYCCKQLLLEQKMGQSGTAYSVQWLGYGLDDRWLVVRILEGTRDSSLHQSDQTGSGDHAAPSQSAGWSLPGVKQPNSEAGHSAAPNGGVKNERMYISIPVCLHGVYRNNITLLYFNRHPYRAVWVTYASVSIAVLNFANGSRNVCSTYDTVSPELWG
jgi:hypothetical protein